MMKHVFMVVACLGIIVFGTWLVYGDQVTEESVKRLDTVVVTGTRTERTVEKIPANVSVIDEEDIKESNAKNVADLLKSETGVIVKDLLGNGKNAQVDLRGFGETGPYNSLVLVDGRRVNEVDLSGVAWTQISLEQIERIEIVRGTGTVLYGDNAVGGVINIITRIPAEELSFSAEAVTGSFGRNKERISLSGGLDNLTAALYASRDSIKGYRPENEFTAKDFGGKIVFDPTDFLSLDITGSLHEDEYDLPGHLTEAQYRANREMNGNPLDEGMSEDYYLKAGLDLDLVEYGNIIADLSYRQRETRAIFPDPSGVFPQGTRGNTETWSVTPRYVREKGILDHENTLIAGIDLYWSEQAMDSFGGYLVPLSIKTGISNTERDSLGIYINDEFSISENLIILLGARRERVRYSFNQRDLSAFPLAPLNTGVTKREKAYNIGVTYLYGDRSTLFARVNRSIRFPLTDEVSYVDWVTWKILANSDLQPQKGQHYEVGVKHYFTPDINGTFTIFRAKINNEIFYNPLTFSNENHPETLHQGLEVGLRVELSDRGDIFGNYSYVKAEFESSPYGGNEIPAIPRHRANIGFRIHDIYPGLVFSADYNYTGSSYAISDHANEFDKIEYYYCINGKVSYDWRSMKIFFGVNNITNEKYAEYGVMDTFLIRRNFYPAPERSWTAGLEITY
ncbi:TonB-dependent receptor [Deltaproteobacteria bacterium]|nr:TonB-dependent receptor [Deltaproteobacteria bacterium]